jgi:hypothetical protein
MEGSPFPLSSRAQPRDLQFRGPLLEMFFDRAHPDSCSAAIAMAACAAFSKESRMKFANATKPNRNSGVAKWRDLRWLLTDANRKHSNGGSCARNPRFWCDQISTGWVGFQKGSFVGMNSIGTSVTKDFNQSAQ